MRMMQAVEPDDDEDELDGVAAEMLVNPVLTTVPLYQPGWLNAEPNWTGTAFWPAPMINREPCGAVVDWVVPIPMIS